MADDNKSAFERVLTARHPERPYSTDLFSTLFSEFVEIHGDRRYADDAAIVCGFAKLGSEEVLVIGQQKGRDTNQRRFRNFGMPKPEGYRKALRAMKLAEKFGRPIITFIDTPGAYPGIDAEERGQAEAIALNLREMAGLKVPVIVVVIGEGGSGGALALGIGDRILMLENAVYSVISPEGCAAILWKDKDKANLAADALRMTAGDLKKLGLVDEIIEERQIWVVPDENGSVDSKESKAFKKTADGLRESLLRHLDEIISLKHDELTRQRFEKFRRMGEWI